MCSAPLQTSFKFKGTTIESVFHGENEKTNSARAKSVSDSVVDTKREEKSMTMILIVKEFSNMFHEDLLGVPRSQVIDFYIKPKLGTDPIS